MGIRLSYYRLRRIRPPTTLSKLGRLTCPIAVGDVVGLIVGDVGALVGRIVGRLVSVRPGQDHHVEYGIHC